MPCPKCGTKVPAKNTKREKAHVRRNYFCRCGQSFTTQEAITREWIRINPMRSVKPSGVAAMISTMIQENKQKAETP